MIQVLQDKERLAIIRLGHFIGLRGPGIVVYIPFITTTFRLRIGDIGNLMTNELAQFGTATIPVVGDELTGSRVKIVGFDDSQPRSRPRVEAISR